MSEPNTKNIYQRFLDVQMAVATVMKNETVKMSQNDRGYKAVTHDDVAAALHMPLAKAGIVLLPTPTKHTFSEFEVEKAGYNGGASYKQRWFRTDIEVTVRWVNADNPQDYFESSSAAFALDTSDKSYAKAYSLALKIILLKVHLLESRDEEESRQFEGNDQQDSNKGKSKNSASASKSESSKIQAKGSSETKAPQKSAWELLTEKAKARKIPVEALKDVFQRGYGSMQVSPDQYKELMAILNEEPTTAETLQAFATIKEEERKASAPEKAPAPAQTPPKAKGPVIQIGHPEYDGLSLEDLQPVGLRLLRDFLGSKMTQANVKPADRNAAFQLQSEVIAELNSRGEA